MEIKCLLNTNFLFWLYANVMFYVSKNNVLFVLNTAFFILLKYMAEILLRGVIGSVTSTNDYATHASMDPDRSPFLEVTTAGLSAGSRTPGSSVESSASMNKLFFSIGK